MIDPGAHSFLLSRLIFLYDPTRLSVDQATAFQLNTTAFPTVLEGPVFDPGRIRVKVSIGYDPTKALTVVTKVATITFTAVGPTNGEEPVVNSENLHMYYLWAQTTVPQITYWLQWRRLS